MSDKGQNRICVIDVPDVQDLRRRADDDAVGSPKECAGEQHLHIFDRADRYGNIVVLEQIEAVQVSQDYADCPAGQDDLKAVRQQNPYCRESRLLKRRQGVKRAQNRRKQSDREQLDEHVEQACEYPPKQQEINDGDRNNSDCEFQARPRNIAHHHADLVQNGRKSGFDISQQGLRAGGGFQNGLPLGRNLQDSDAQLHSKIVNPEADAAPILKALQQRRRNRNVDELFYQALNIRFPADQRFTKPVNDPKQKQIGQKRLQFGCYGIEERLTKRERFLIEHVKNLTGIARFSHQVSP